jgi:hypothetical protein
LERSGRAPGPQSAALAVHQLESDRAEAGAEAHCGYVSEDLVLIVGPPEVYSFLVCVLLVALLVLGLLLGFREAPRMR